MATELFGALKIKKSHLIYTILIYLNNFAYVSKYMSFKWDFCIYFLKFFYYYLGNKWQHDRRRSGGS